MKHWSDLDPRAAHEDDKRLSSSAPPGLRIAQREDRLRAGDPKKLTNYARGLLAEMVALVWLSLKGYRIVRWRYKQKMGEIDLLISKGKTLAVVEVKARPTIDLAVSAMYPRAWQRHRHAVLRFVQQHPYYQQHAIRFDLVALAPYTFPNHLRDVWRHGFI